MWYRHLFVGSIILLGSFLLYYIQTRRLLFKTNELPYGSSQRNKSIHHTAIILARRPTTRVLKHLNALVNVGVDAFVMCDEQPANYTNVTHRILYVSDESLAQYGLTRNLVWDRVFVWLYNQTWIDYVWLMEDDLTWTNAHHMVNLFNKYAMNQTDLLSRDITFRNNQTLRWMWWPKIFLKLLPEYKWSAALNMLSRVSRRLINAHEYYVRKLFDEKKKLNLNVSVFDNNYYFQEFLIPTAAHMFNLTMVIYDHSNMEVFFTALSENEIRESLAKGKQIFHAVKHDSQLLINATQLKRK